MKKVGLIGGLSWESSYEYYRIINEEINKKLGGTHSAEILMYSVDFQIFDDFMSSGDWDSAGKKLAGIALTLQNAGAEFIVLATNTMHKLVPVIESRINIPLLHIADATAERIKSENFSTVGLLGTRFTMTEDFYIQRLESRHSLKVLVPDSGSMETVDEIIFKELVTGIINQGSRKKLLDIIAGLQSKGAQCIILGCTELGLIVKDTDTEIRLFDTTEIHASAAVRKALDS